MTKISAIIPIMAIAAIAGCTVEPASPPDVAAQAPSLTPAPGQPGPVPPLATDECRASERSGWIGRSIDGLPETPAGETWRRVCTTCQKTDDHRPERLNIIFDETSRRITAVNCG